MKIDRARAQRAFADYAAHYNTADPKVKLKTPHLPRGSPLRQDRRKSFAAAAGHRLAWLSGILHDVGRFEQLRRYNTFIDAQSVSHAALSVSVLFDEGRIRDYLDDTNADSCCARRWSGTAPSACRTDWMNARSGSARSCGTLIRLTSCASMSRRRWKKFTMSPQPSCAKAP